MNTRKILIGAIAGCSIALAGGNAMATPDCSTITTIGQWAQAQSCLQGDKLWTLESTSTNLLSTVQVLFSNPTINTHNMQIIGFDTSDAAATWTVNYSITVTDPSLFYISAMFAGADNPGGGSLLTKNVTGDPGGPFTLTDTDGNEGPTAQKTGLHSTALDVNEVFSVNAGANLLSVSNTYLESRLQAPEPASLALLAIGLVGLGFSRRRSPK